MIKELQYKGYATEPSDYECPDGQLATSLNLISEHQALRPIQQPKTILSLHHGERVLYLHKTNLYTHYIIQDNAGFLYWSDTSETNPEKTDNNTLEQLTDVSVTSLGNTLLLLTPTRMSFYIWRHDDLNYRHLGNQMPETPLSFGLTGRMERNDEGQTIELAEPEYTADIESGKELKEANQKLLTEKAMAIANKFIADKAVAKGRFIFPFFVRYAYRLFDGTLTMHSAPVLMLASTLLSPRVVCGVVLSDNVVSQVHASCAAMTHQLDYCCLSASAADNLAGWNDIIRSIDIFISAPLYTYKQSGTVKRIDASPGSIEDDCMICALESEQGQSPDYRLRTFINEYDRAFPGENPAEIMLPYYTQEEQMEKLKDCGLFYLLKSIPIEQLANERTPISIPENYLETLTQRELMTDDYLSHNTMTAACHYIYNQRLHLGDIAREIFQGFPPQTAVCYATPHEGAQYALLQYGQNSIRMFVQLKKEGKSLWVEADGSGSDMLMMPSFIFYPDTDACQVLITDGTRYFSSPMKPHNMLNGAIAYTRWSNHIILLPAPSSLPTPAEGQQLITHHHNQIIVSEAGNPWAFKPANIMTVSNGRILALRSATKAMSTGQFGQFPLYAFTTEGVWALEVSSTGSYSARQPITRDVCINADSITQLDSSVLFATDRGIMLISGSQTQCITDSIFSEAPFNVLDLPGIDQLHAKLGHSADACLPMQPFLGFLAGCQMVYDYVHQRIFVYNPTKVNGSPKYTYAYVFSLQSKMWGMVFSDLASTINAYPEALAMTHDNKLVSFSDSDEQVCKGLYITRPLKLEAADVQKTISTLIQRGHFQRGDVGTVLYGSRDLFTWHLVWSSKDHYLRGFRGTPYKYFRIAGIATLTEGKSIFGASINFEPRHTNQLR